MAPKPQNPAIQSIVSFIHVQTDQADEASTAPEGRHKRSLDILQPSGHADRAPRRHKVHTPDDYLDGDIDQSNIQAKTRPMQCLLFHHPPVAKECLPRLTGVRPAQIRH